MLELDNRHLAIEDRAESLREAWQAILANVDKLLAIRAEKSAAEQSVEQLKARLHALPQPRRVEDFEEYIRWVLDWEAAEAAVSDAVRALDQIERAEAEIEKAIIAAVYAPMVWFKHGDIGFGVAFSDWGGSHHYVMVAPWAEAMPDLDRRLDRR